MISTNQYYNHLVKTKNRFYVGLLLVMNATFVHAQTWKEIRHTEIFTLTSPEDVFPKQFRDNYFIFKKSNCGIVVSTTVTKTIDSLFRRFPSLFDSLFKKSTYKIEGTDLAKFEIDFNKLSIEKVIAIQSLKLTNVNNRHIWHLTVFGHTTPCFIDAEILTTNFNIWNAGCEL